MGGAVLSDTTGYEYMLLLPDVRLFTFHKGLLSIPWQATAPIVNGL